LPIAPTTPTPFDGAWLGAAFGRSSPRAPGPRTLPTKTVGGSYTSRAHRGDGKDPFTPITADEQRTALALIVNNALKSNA